MIGRLSRVGAWLLPGRACQGLPVAVEAGEPGSLPGPWPAGMALAMHSREEREGRTATADLLDRFKYAGERTLAPLLGRALAEAVRSRPGFEQVEAVVHVPATTRRPRVEPACDLAREVAKALRVRCLPGLVARTREMEHQKDIVRWAEKTENVRGAFRVRRPEFLRGRKLLLVDDVYDSGATLEEAWRTVMQAGAREVVVAAITRTRYRREA